MSYGPRRTSLLCTDFPLWPVMYCTCSLVILVYIGAERLPQSPMMLPDLRVCAWDPVNVYHISLSVYVCTYLCMHACMYVCIYECMHVCLHICMYLKVHMCIHEQVETYTQTCKHASMQACMHACGQSGRQARTMHAYIIYMYIHIYICTTIHMYKCIYLYIPSRYIDMCISTRMLIHMHACVSPHTIYMYICRRMCASFQKYSRDVED